MLCRYLTPARTGPAGRGPHGRRPPAVHQARNASAFMVGPGVRAIMMHLKSRVEARERLNFSQGCLPMADQTMWGKVLRPLRVCRRIARTGSACPRPRRADRLPFACKGEPCGQRRRLSSRLVSSTTTLAHPSPIDVWPLRSRGPNLPKQHSSPLQVCT